MTFEYRVTVFHLWSDNDIFVFRSVQPFFFFFWYFFVPLMEIRVALLWQGAAAARAALPIPISVCSIFVCPNNGMATSVLDF